MNEDEIKIDRRSYLVVHQAYRKWENLYLLIHYSAATNSWLSKVCSEYDEGDEYWRTKGVKLLEHPHRSSFNHSNALLLRTNSANISTSS